MKKILGKFLIFLLAVPVSVGVAFLLYPLWNWVEMNFGIESVGHAMIAPWCMVATYAVLLLVWFSCQKIVKKKV